MRLKVLGSSSKGNCYLLQGKGETLIIECGIRFEEVKEVLEFDLSSIVGCLVTHEHKDHCKYINKVIDAGIDVYLSKGTAEALKINSHRANMIKPVKTFNIGGYKVLPFDVKHDCKEPMGFLIHHKDMGNLLFATDTYYIEYKFENLNHILVECNYSIDILNKNVEDGRVHPVQKKRVLRSHFELENTKEFFKANDLKGVKNIVLLHLSDGNSNLEIFKTEIQNLTGKEVYVADKGLEVDLSLYPF
jgi:phosphoribosyl 1,2-cyclic phosphodiesterase